MYTLSEKLSHSFSNGIIPIFERVRDLFMRREKLSMISLGGLFFLSLTVMGIVSLAVLNDKATKGYMLNKLELERQVLVSDGEITDTLIMRSRSIQTIEKNARGMVPAGGADITYVVPVSVVAQNK